MSNILIALSGKTCSGKTTAANYLAKKYGGSVIGFATPLKLECYRVLGNRNGDYGEFAKEYPSFDLHALPTPPSGLDGPQAVNWINTNKSILGDFLQLWGDFRRKSDPDYFVGKLHAAIESHIVNGTDNIYVDDARYLNELDSLGNIGFEHIRVQSGDAIRKKRGANRNPLHPSETELDSYYFSHTVFNNLEPYRLYEQLDSIVAVMKKNHRKVSR